LLEHFEALRSEETIDLAFDEKEFAEAIDTFREAAHVLFDGCDVSRTGGVTEKQYDAGLSRLRKAATTIRHHT
jgi:hypothetical protein